jgi:putative aldouronate transport system substrate-binding protein
MKPPRIGALSAAACALALLSCSRPGSSAGAPAAVSAPGTFPIVKQRAALTAIAPTIGFIKDWKTNSSYLWRERLTNVKVDFIETTRTEARTKLSVMLASGDYPDIVFGMSGSGLSAQDVSRYGEQGVFVPLNGLIEKYGYETSQMLEAVPEIRKAITSPDGNIYALPLVAMDDYHLTMRQKAYINKSWLDRLGLDAPTTTEEFYRVMKAFKERDPNGNGVADEIPMTGAKRSQEDLAMWIMNAFVVAGGPDESADATLNCYEYIVDGKVFFNADKPQFREGLRFLNRLFRDGLIDVAALTRDKSQIKPLVDGGTVRVGLVASHHPANFCGLSDDMTAPIHQYAALPPIRGPEGNRTTPWIIDAIVQPGQFAITDKCRDPVIAFRWGDSFFDLEATLADKGIEGVHWARVGPGERLVGINGKPAKYKYLKSLSLDDNAQIGFGPGWTRDIKNEFAASADKFSYEESLYDATKLYDPYKVRRFPYATAPIADSDISEFNDLRRTIHTYIGESVDRFIIGDLDAGRDWDAYVRQLDQIGISRYLQILGKAYEAYSR